MKRISTYREPLMGIAILWIVLFHAEVTFPSWLLPLTWLKEAGYGGVDIFLLLSGLGLHFSLAKDDRLPRYYKNRFTRILPTYWTVIGLATAMEFVLLHRHSSLLSLFYVFSTLGFWLNATKFDWYIPSILVLYAVFPLYFYIFRRSRHKAWVTGSVTGIGILLSLAITWSPLNYLLIFTTRIPIFFIGAHIGYLIREGKAEGLPAKERQETGSPVGGREAQEFPARHRESRELPPLFKGLILAMGVAWLAYSFGTYTEAELWKTGLWWYPFILITPFLCEGIAKSFKWSSGFALSHGLSKCLHFCGKYSLEIYLVHTLVFGLHKETARYFAFDRSGICAYTIYFLVSLPLAFILHQAVGYLTQWLFTRKNAVTPHV